MEAAMTTPPAPDSRPPLVLPAGTTSEREAAILAQFRARGGRVTSARRAIVHALLTQPTHLSGEDLAALVQADLPDVHVSSVYRNLAELEQMGIVHHVHFGHGASMYRLDDERRHVHLVCEQCGRTTSIDSDELRPLVAELQEQHDFVVDLDHFALVGTCAVHAQPARARRR
jgi:Fur family ferric uptake transcriptional regulator